MPVFGLQIPAYMLYVRVETLPFFHAVFVVEPRLHSLEAYAHLTRSIHGVTYIDFTETTALQLGEPEITGWWQQRAR